MKNYRLFMAVVIVALILFVSTQSTEASWWRDAWDAIKNFDCLMGPEGAPGC